MYQIGRRKSIHENLFFIGRRIGWENPIAVVKNCCFGVGIPTRKERIPRFLGKDSPLKRIVSEINTRNLFIGTCILELIE